jgi:hypothetical protein
VKASNGTRARAKAKSTRARKVVPKQAQRTKLQSVREIETTVVDVISEPRPGLITLTEFEETKVRQNDEDSN